MPTRNIDQISLPTSAMGTDRTLTVIKYGRNQTGQKAYIQAGLHADEPPGIIALHYLIGLLDKADADDAISGRIIIVPVANPIGLDQWDQYRLGGRFDQASGINFNRNHLDLIDAVVEEIKDGLTDKAEENVKLIRQAMAKALDAVAPKSADEFLKKLLYSLSCDADIVLDLHCDEEALLHVYTGSPLWPQAEDLAAQMGSEVTLLADNSGGDPYDEACSKIWWTLAEKYPNHPIPTACLAATVELRGQADVTHETGQKDAQNLYNFLQRRGYIQGDAPELPKLITPATPLSGVEHVLAPCPGVVVYPKKPGSRVAKGEIVAQIINPLSLEPTTDVFSGIDGILFSTRTDRYARPGAILIKIAGEEPLEGKGKHLLTA